MIYDNGDLTLDADKGCGALYEIETILDEIADWFADTYNLENASVDGTPFDSLGQNIAESGLTKVQVGWMIHDAVHHIKSNMEYTDQPLVLVDTAV